MEQVYKTMRAAGVINIVIGSVLITVGLAAGVLAIVSGSFLLVGYAHWTFLLFEKEGKDYLLDETAATGTLHVRYDI